MTGQLRPLTAGLAHTGALARREPHVPVIAGQHRSAAARRGGAGWRLRADDRADLTDGPVSCGDNPNRFDADLFRVRESPEEPPCRAANRNFAARSEPVAMPVSLPGTSRGGYKQVPDQAFAST
jgi:hypothetical protein